MLRRIFIHCILVLLAFAGTGMPARAAIETDHLERSVVRVVIVEEDIFGRQTVVGHGSGFAVTPTQIVTNAHVVAPYQQRKAAGIKTGLWIVRARGGDIINGYLDNDTSVSQENDLALIRMAAGASLPRATLFSGTVTAQTDVAALGYPGNVDSALGRTSDDSKTVPRAPEAREARLSSVNANGAPWNPLVGVYVHSAAISRGDSGGPLADGCGRIIGVNESVTPTNEADAHFGFAVASPDLQAFLRRNDVKFAETTEPCVSSIEAEQARFEASLAERDKTIKDLADQKDASAAAQRRADIFGLLWGAVALGAVGFAFWRLRAKDKVQAGISGAVALAAVYGVYSVESGATKKADTPNVIADNGMASCRLDRVASHIVFSAGPSDDGAGFKLEDAACFKEKTLFARDGNTLNYAALRTLDESVAISSVDLTSGRFTQKNYLLDLNTYNRAVEISNKYPHPECAARKTDKNAIRQVDQRYRETIAILPKKPTETLVWTCKTDTPAPDSKTRADNVSAPPPPPPPSTHSS